jgi:hypothetical protein
MFGQKPKATSNKQQATTKTRALSKQLVNLLVDSNGPPNKNKNRKPPWPSRHREKRRKKHVVFCVFVRFFGSFRAHQNTANPKNMAKQIERKSAFDFSSFFLKTFSVFDMFVVFELPPLSNTEKRDKAKISRKS